MIEEALTLHWLLQNQRLGGLAAAQFQSELEGACDFAFRFPLDVKTKGRTFPRIFSQVVLVDIPIIKTGVERMATLPIEEMGKNFDDLSRASQSA